MTDDRPAVARQAAHDVLIYHQQTSTSGCSCGRVELGQSYTFHVVDVLIVSGVLRDAADVRRDALAAVEALAVEWEQGKDNRHVLPAQYAADKLRAVLAGDSSALDAVKAAERERVLEAAKAEAPSLLAAERLRVLRVVDVVVGEAEAADVASRIAREGGAA